MTITFGPPSYNWDGGVQSLFQKEALTAFYHLLSIDSGPALAGVSVTGTTQQTGYQIAATNTWFSSVVSGGAAVLPETSTPYSLSGVKIYVTNTSPTVLTIFANPADAGNSINGSAPNVGYSLPGGTFQIFHCYAPGLWLAAPLANFTQTAGLIIGGSTSASTLTLESTSGTGTTDAIIFKTGSQVERMRIDTLGRIVTGGATSFASLFGDIPALQINNASGSNRGMISIAGWSADANAPNLYFTKSRSTTIGVQTAVLNNDSLAYIGVGGSDGTNFQVGGAINAVVDGAVAANSVPLRWEFLTGATGGGVERLRIDSSGNVNIGMVGSTVNAFNSTLPIFQIGTANASTPIFVDARMYSNDTTAPTIASAKSRGTSIGSNVAVQSGDGLLSITAAGYDATGTPVLQQSAKIRFSCDAAPTAGSVAGNITFLTAVSGSATTTERMRIDSTGQVIINNAGNASPSGGSFLTVNDIDGSGKALLANQWSADTNDALIAFQKSRSGTVGTNTLVNQNDFLGGIYFGGGNGTNFASGALIRGFVDASTTAGQRVPAALLFYTSPNGGSLTERLRIDSAGDIIIGGTSSVASFSVTAPFVQAHTAGNSASCFFRWSPDNFASTVEFAKSPSGTIGTHTAVDSVTNFNLGQITFSGSDGTNFKSAAQIKGQVDAAVSAGIVPGRLTFFTNNTSGTATERLRITSLGSIMMSASALSTSATDGFFYMNSCAGAPTGAPTAAPGAAAAMVIDTTNSKIWVRIGGTWKGVVVA